MLKQQIADWEARARVAAEDAQKAIDENRLEDAESLHTTANAALKTLATLKAQAELAEAVAKEDEPVQKDDVTADTQADEETKTEKAVRVPFDVAEKTEKDNDPKPSAAYTLRFGEQKEALGQVTKEVYGVGYADDVATQHRAFRKYLAVGPNVMDRDEMKSVHNLILTPETIESEILSGRNVAEIKQMKGVQQEAVLNLGGVLVPEDFRLQMVRRIADLSSFRQFARVVNTTRDHVEYPVLLGGDKRYTSGARVTWVDEIPSDADGAGTQVEFGSIRVPVHTVMARIDPSRNLLEDAGMDVAAFIANVFAESFAIDEAEQFISGTGTGRPLGILGERSNGDLSPLTGIATVNTGGSDTIQADGLIDLVYDLDAQYLPNATMWGAKDAFKDIRKLKDTTNQYLWQPGLAPGEPPTVLGYPFYMQEAMPNVAANQHVLIFGDLSAYIIAERVGMTVERVSDSTTVGRNKVAIFGRRRIGGNVAAPWALRVQKVSA